MTAAGKLCGAVCELCGEPMPPGEEVFKYHGFSGPCPKPRRTPLDSIPKGEVNPREPDTFGFGEALERMEQGRFLTRRGWNGRGMSVTIRQLQAGDPFTQPYLVMYPDAGQCVPWTISQTDALAKDWFEVVVDDTCRS